MIKFVIVSAVIMFIVLITTLALIYIYQYKDKKTRKTWSVEMAINRHITQLAIDGKMDIVYKFYDRYTKERPVTILIVNNALSHEIPINIMFGVCHQESRFMIGAVGRNKTSNDYGLFQLNSISYAAYSKKYLLQPSHNVRMAAGHLRGNYNKYNNWPESIIAYNHGNTKEVPNHVLKYYINVDDYSKKLDDQFYEYLERIN